ncbi:MAG: hypothetical protein J0H94_01500 [Rhizobiales bacterium]|nr:hypothetical protein [Hyphomicrobiales bacterium]
MDTSAPILVVPNSPGVARAFGVFWVASALLGLAFATHGAGFGEEGWYVTLMVGLGLFITLVGTILGVLSFARARIRGPLLTIGPEGLRDAGVSDRLIPWPALSWRHEVYFRGAAIMYDVDETVTGPLTLGLPIRILAAANRAFGYGRFSLMTMGTGKSLEELAELLSAYKAESPR